LKDTHAISLNHFWRQLYYSSKEFFFQENGILKQIAKREKTDNYRESKANKLLLSQMTVRSLTRDMANPLPGLFSSALFFFDNNDGTVSSLS